MVANLSTGVGGTPQGWRSCRALRVLPVAGFLGPSGFASGQAAAFSAHRAVNAAGALSSSALCGRTRL